ncbi:MAG: hypothetical protein RSA66_09755 [Muribaculaceae bacterium]
MSEQASQQNDTEQNVQARTDDRAEDKYTHEVDILEHVTTNRDITTDLESDEQEQIVEREYDTTLPVNSITGRPPLKKETTKNRQKIDSGKRQDNTRHVADSKMKTFEKVESKSNVANSIEINGIDKTTMSAQISTTEKRGNTVWNTLWLVGLLVVLYYIIRIVTNIRKK